MNRAERRKAGVKNLVPTYNMNTQQIQTLKEDVAQEATERAFILMLGIPAMVLRDHFRFGRKRMEKFTDEVFELYDSYEKDYITLDDLIQTIYQETGVKIEKK